MLFNLCDLLKELEALRSNSSNYICSIKMVEIAKNFLQFVGEKISVPPSIYSTCHNSVRFCWSHLNGDFLWVELWSDGDCKLTVSRIGSEKVETFLYSYSSILSEILLFESE